MVWAIVDKALQAHATHSKRRTSLRSPKLQMPEQLPLTEKRESWTLRTTWFQSGCKSANCNTRDWHKKYTAKSRQQRLSGLAKSDSVTQTIGLKSARNIAPKPLCLERNPLCPESLERNCFSIPQMPFDMRGGWVEGFGAQVIGPPTLNPEKHHKPSKTPSSASAAGEKK